MIHKENMCVHIYQKIYLINYIFNKIYLEVINLKYIISHPMIIIIKISKFSKFSLKLYNILCSIHRIQKLNPLNTFLFIDLDEDDDSSDLSEIDDKPVDVDFDLTKIIDNEFAGWEKFTKVSLIS